MGGFSNFSDWYARQLVALRALINGNVEEVFNVASATAAAHAVRLEQVRGTSFKIASAATQNPTSAVPTKIIFGTSLWDKDEEILNSTYTAKRAGYFRICACAAGGADTSLTDFFLRLYKNAAQVAGRARTGMTGNGYHTIELNEDILLAVGDTIEVYALLMGTGANRYIFADSVSYTTSFSAEFIREP